MFIQQWLWGGAILKIIPYLLLAFLIVSEYVLAHCVTA